MHGNDSGDALRFPEPPRKLDAEAFVERFGAVYEHSLWIARETWRQGVGKAEDSVAGLASALASTLDRAGHARQLALIRAHPDLAGRAAVRGALTEDSTGEQASAGLDQCTPQEFERFQSLNAAYKNKFGFPFIMAVRDSNRHAILAAFEQRLENDPSAEFARALDEINKIARLRLQALARK